MRIWRTEDEMRFIDGLGGARLIAYAHTIGRRQRWADMDAWAVADHVARRLRAAGVCPACLERILTEAPNASM